MKNRRFVIIAIVLVAVLCLGVAFAALVDDLSIGGSLDVDNEIANADFNNDVHFDTSDAKIPSAELPLSAKAGSNVKLEIQDVEGDKNDHLSVTVPAGVLNFTGEEVVVTAYIKNESTEFDANVRVTNSSTVDDGGLCDITCEFDGADQVKIEKGASKPVTITIKLKETVTGDEPSLSGTFNFDISATAVKPNN